MNAPLHDLRTRLRQLLQPGGAERCDGVGALVARHCAALEDCVEEAIQSICRDSESVDEANVAARQAVECLDQFASLAEGDGAIFVDRGTLPPHYSFRLPDLGHIRLSPRSPDQEGSGATRVRLAVSDPVVRIDDSVTVALEVVQGERRGQRSLNEEICTRLMADPAFGAGKAMTGEWPVKERLAAHIDAFTDGLSKPRVLQRDWAARLESCLDRTLADRLFAAWSDGDGGATSARIAQSVRASLRPVIERIGSLEDAKIHVWRRQKLILESHWCVSLDRIPDPLLGAIAECQAQIGAWFEMAGFPECEAALQVGEPLPREFLRAHPTLVVDTSHFDAVFKRELVAALGELRPTGWLVHGDNLHAMRLLEKRFEASVRVATIDPPYNTGNAGVYVYRDALPRTEWAASVEQRLEAARSLLATDGVLWANIDDHETHALRTVMDKVFGEQAFVSTVTWRKKVVRGRGARHVLPQTEYIHAYARDPKQLPPFFEPLTPEMVAEYRWSDEQGPYKRIPLAKTGTTQSPRPNLFYPIEGPDGTMIECPTQQWRWSRETLASRADEIEYVRRRDGSWGVFTKQRLVVEGATRQRTPVSFYDRVTTTHGTAEIKALFGRVVADFPKPTQLLQDLIGWSEGPQSPSDALVLDFYAGSGSTGDAVLRLNRGDKGQRRFLLVECGAHFDSVLRPRIARAAFANRWVDGEPVDKDGTSVLYSTLRLESYDDALQSITAVEEGAFPDDAAFASPFDWSLPIGPGGAARAVDLVETFNWLLGLRVDTVTDREGVVCVRAVSATGERHLVLWRDQAQVDEATFARWLEAEDLSGMDRIFDSGGFQGAVPCPVEPIAPAFRRHLQPS